VTFGRTWLACGSVLSTMDVAREHFTRTGEHGVVVQARVQTAGRGRLGKVWFTPPEGTQVSLTVIGYPVPVQEAWLLAPLTGVAIAEGIASVLPECGLRVRFPNDVLLNGRKLSGVLIETLSIVGQPELCVPLIGIGINVNISAGAFPTALQQQATSLRRELEREITEPIASTVVRALERLWGESVEEWLPRWHALLDLEASRVFVLDGRAQRCRVVLLGADGKLVVETEEGELRAISAAQVILGEE
jgi:BirA family transcriptional regulator, biotin operon repressor / biotin---[acetyl-CoA-carboxylase] ligase